MTSPKPFPLEKPIMKLKLSNFLRRSSCITAVFATLLSTLPVHGDYASDVLADSPILYYRFDGDGPAIENKGSLGSAADGMLSEMGADLGHVSAFEQLGNAVSLNGLDGFVEIPALGDPLPAVTIEFWLMRTLDFSGLAAIYAPDGWSAGYLHFNLATAGPDVQVEFAVNGNPTPFPRFEPDWGLNEWHHIAVTFQAEGDDPRIKFYFDGSLSEEVPLENGEPLLFAPGRIGAWLNTFADPNELQRRLGGLVDEFAIYPSVLSEERISAHYNNLDPSVKILQESADVGVVEGQSARFHVVAGGLDPQYQWFRDGELIPGATDPEFVIEETSPADDGAVFTVEVSNSINRVTSREARLTVLAQPSDDYGLAVMADAPLVYYRLNETSGLVAENLGTLGSSAEGSYSPFGVTHGRPSAFPDLGFSVWLDGSEGRIGLPALDKEELSQLSVELWLNRTFDWPGLTAILANDVWQSGALHLNLTLAEGASTPQLEFAVNGNPAQRFQPEWPLEEWRHLVLTYDAEAEPGQLKFYLDGTLHSQAEINGATPVNWTGGGIGMWNTSRQMEAFVDEFALYGNVLSPERIAAHYNTVQTDVAIVAAPEDVTVLRGEPAMFTVAASGPNPQYQWFENGEEIPGATAAEYAIEAASPDQDGSRFSVEVQNNNNSVTSPEAVLTVVSEVSIVTGPSDTAVPEGGTAKFTVEAAGPDIQYQWLRDGAEIPGAVDAVFSVVADSDADGALFSVRVSNDVNSVTSEEATLTVVSTPAGSYASVVLEAEPVVFYRFEETTGTVAQNLGTLGNVADGVYSATGLTFEAQSAGPELSQALGFDDGHVVVPDLGLGSMEQISVELWVNRQADPSDFFALFATDGWNAGGLHFNIWSGGQAEFAVNGNPSPWPRWSPGEIGEWNHWVATYDVAEGNQEIKVYVNGELILESDAITSPITLSGGQIGMWGETRAFLGILDEFAIYSSVLTSEQVLRHFAAARVATEEPEEVQLHSKALPATGELELSWSVAGFVLESTADLSLENSWTAVADGSASPVLIRMDEAHRFYRLRKE